MNGEQKSFIDTIHEIEQTFQRCAEADRKERTFAKTMYWMLNLGFFATIVNYWTLQLPAIGVAGAILMAAPIVWISWKEGL